jgi:hypothetical protein
MIEESLMEFLKDRHAEKRLLYELAATATGSYKFRSDGCGMLRRVYKGVKLWWQLLDLPCVEKDCERCLGGISRGNSWWLA